MFLVENFNEVTKTERTFCEGVDGLFEIALESEMSWNNIINNAMVEEFNAIKNEDAAGLKKGAAEVFKKIIDWIKKKAEWIAGFFKDLFKKITDQGYRLKAFYEKNKEALNAFSGEVEVEVYSWTTADPVKKATTVGTNALKQLNTLINKGVTDVTVDSVCNDEFGVEFKEIGAYIGKNVRNGESKESKKITNIKGAVRTVQTYGSMINNFKYFESDLQNKLKGMLVEAKKGLAEAEKDSDAANEAMKKINSMKAVSTVSDKILAVVISLSNQAVADSLLICKKALGAGKKASGETAEAEETKNESFF